MVEDVSEICLLPKSLLIQATQGLGTSGFTTGP